MRVMCERKRAREKGGSREREREREGKRVEREGERGKGLRERESGKGLREREREKEDDNCPLRDGGGAYGSARVLIRARYSLAVSALAPQSAGQHVYTYIHIHSYISRADRKNVCPFVFRAASRLSSPFYEKKKKKKKKTKAAAGVYICTYTAGKGGERGDDRRRGTTDVAHMYRGGRERKGLQPIDSDCSRDRCGGRRRRRAIELGKSENKQNTVRAVMMMMVMEGVKGWFVLFSFFKGGVGVYLRVSFFIYRRD